MSAARAPASLGHDLSRPPDPCSLDPSIPLSLTETRPPSHTRLARCSGPVKKPPPICGAWTCRLADDRLSCTEHVDPRICCGPHAQSDDRHGPCQAQPVGVRQASPPNGWNPGRQHVRHLADAVAGDGPRDRESPRSPNWEHPCVSDPPPAMPPPHPPRPRRCSGSARAATSPRTTSPPRTAGSPPARRVPITPPPRRPRPCPRTRSNSPGAPVCWAPFSAPPPCWRTSSRLCAPRRDRRCPSGPPRRMRDASFCVPSTSHPPP